MSEAARPRRRDADENLDALLEAAVRVLEDNPAASMAEIASASGLGRVTAWRHVGSRERLLALLHERAVTEIHDELQRVLGDAAATPDDVGRAVETLAQIGLRYRVLFFAQPAAERRAGRRAALAPLALAIALGQRSGALRADVAPELTAALVAEAALAALGEAAREPRTLNETIAGARRFVCAALEPPDA